MISPNFSVGEVSHAIANARAVVTAAEGRVVEDVVRFQAKSQIVFFAIGKMREIRVKWHRFGTNRFSLRSQV